MAIDKEGPAKSTVSIGRVTDSIVWIRDQKVMLSTVLAGMYGVETRALIQVVKRNIQRFPDDFMFHADPG